MLIAAAAGHIGNGLREQFAGRRMLRPAHVRAPPGEGFVSIGLALARISRRLADSTGRAVPHRARPRKLPIARLATDAMTSTPPISVARLGRSSMTSHTHIGARMNSMRMSSVSSAPGT